MSSYPFIQNVPQVSVNEEEAVLAVWIKDEGEYVKKGQEIAEFETTKAVVEVVADIDGYLFHLVEMGDKIRIGAPFAVFSEDNNPEVKNSIDLKSGDDNKASIDTKDKKYTKKAAILAKKHGVDIEKVPAAGIIQEADVMTYLRLGDKKDEEVSDLVLDVYPGNMNEILKSYDAKKERIILLGGGRGAVQVIDAVLRGGKQEIVGILDDNDNIHGKKILGYEILGPISRVHELNDQNKFDSAAITFSNDLEGRAVLYEKLTGDGIKFTNVIDPSVQLHSNLEMGTGNVIIGNCRIGACSIIGNNNFLSAYVNIEHHNVLGNHCTFGPAVFTSSRAQIGDRVKFGTGIYIEPGVKVGSQSIVSSGSVLTVDIPEKSIVKKKFDYSVQPRKN